MLTFIFVPIFTILLLAFESSAALQPVPLDSSIKSHQKVLETTFFQKKVLQGARNEIKKGVVYSPQYFRIKYPMGDIPANKGVCTDLVVRAFRNAGIDLQQKLHEDMKRNFKKYPQLWGRRSPDSNIDHRRVPNQMTFFKRHGLSLPLEVHEKNLKEWQPADVVFWKLDNGLLHAGIVSDRLNEKSVPFVIHNIGTPAEEDVMTEWKIIGHFRYPKSSH